MAMLNKRRVSMVCQLDTSTVGWVNWTNKKNSKTLLLFHQPNGRGTSLYPPGTGRSVEDDAAFAQEDIGCKPGDVSPGEKGGPKTKRKLGEATVTRFTIVYYGLLRFTMVYHGFPWFTRVLW